MATIPAWTQGDTTPPVQTTIQDENGPVNLFGANVLFTAKQRDGSKVIQGWATVIDVSDVNASPNVEYVWAQDGSDSAVPGIYDLEWRVTFGPGSPDERTETFPGGEYDTIKIKPRLSS